MEKTFSLRLSRTNGLSPLEKVRGSLATCLQILASAYGEFIHIERDLDQSTECYDVAMGRNGVIQIFTIEEVPA